MAAVPSIDQSELLSSVSTYMLCHTFVTSDYDQQWVEYLASRCRIFDDWKAGASEWYLHCSGRPRYGKTTCMAALARHLREDRQLPQSRKSAVVTLFLDVYEIKVQQLRHCSPLVAILRAILRQLKDQLSPSLDLMPEIQIEDLAHLREMVRAAVQHFEQTYLLIDDVHEIPDLSADAIFSELHNLDIRSMAFFGLPLNRTCGDHTIDLCCDNCMMESIIWAICESCKQCYCDVCYGTGQRCCSNMMGPSMVVEIPLNLDPEEYVKLALYESLPDWDAQQLQDALMGILRETRDSLVLAKLSLDDFLENKRSNILDRTRDRLPGSTIHYFNLALLRVKHQASSADVALGMAALSIVSLAEYNGLPFEAFLGILSKVEQRSGVAGLFGERLDRARISRVTKGWLSIRHVADEMTDPKIALFHNQAWTYLNEEASGFHKDALGEEGGGLAQICLEVLIGIAPSFDDCLSNRESVLRRDSTQALHWYALDNWGHHFRQHASQVTRDAAREFLLRYENSRSLRKYHRRARVNKRPVGGALMHLLADFGLHELIDHVPADSADLTIVDGATGLTPAMIACAAGNTAFVSALLSRGATDKANPLFNFTPRCRMGKTAIWYAIQHQRLDVVRLLLSQRGSGLVNLQDSQGKTPLMLAIEHRHDIAIDAIGQRNHDAIIKLLMGCESLEMDVTDSFGRTALHIAALCADHSAVALLMERPAGTRMMNRRERNAMKRTALMVLLSRKSNMKSRRESVRILLRSGADAGLSDSRGRTALHYAAVSDDFSGITRELIKAEALLCTNVSLVHYALQLARAHGAEQTVALLLPLRSGAESNSSSNMNTASSEQRVADLAPCTEAMTAGKRDVLPTRGGPIVSVAHLLNYNQLHSAVRDASLNEVRTLLASATNEALDVNGVTIDGDSALHLAVYALEQADKEDDYKQCSSFEHIIEALLEHVDIQAENALNEKAIHLAARLIPDKYETLIAILEVSIRSGMDLRTIRIARAQKCLQFALTGERRCSAQLVGVLLDSGASVHQPIDYGVSTLPPRVVAQQEGLSGDVVDVLLQWE